MIFEIATDVMAGVGIFFAGRGAYRSLRKKTVERGINKEPLDMGGSPYRTNALTDTILGANQESKPEPKVMNWAWDQDAKPKCHVCPKCLHYQRTNEQTVAIIPKICDCSQYHKEHFHFKCYKCNFQSIMRTADDKGEEKK